MKRLEWKCVILMITIKWMCVERSMATFIPTVNSSEQLKDKKLNKLKNKFIPKLNLKTMGKNVKDIYPDAGVMEDIEFRISGGKQARRGQFPWQVGIKMDDVEICGGSIISKYWILTSATCVEGFKNFAIYVGMQQRKSPESGRIVFETDRKLMHPQFYKQYFYNNIALLRVLSGIPMNRRDAPYARPIRLPKLSEDTKRVTYEGVKTIVGGWGKIGITGNTSDELHYVEFNIISNSECSKKYGSKFVIQTTICVSTIGGTSTCKGDTGNPMVYKEKDGKWTQIGIASFAPLDNCTIGLPAAFIRTASYLKWINLMTGLKIRP